MRLPSFRIRTLMLAVAVVALLLWSAMMGTRSYVYYGLATTYHEQGRLWREMAVRDRANRASARSVAALWGDQTADFYEPLERKYRQAMRRPWRPVAPDPPAPVFGAPAGK